LCDFVREQEQTPGSCWHVGEGEAPLSYSQIRRYAAKAEARILRSVRTSPKRQLRLHLAKRRNLFAKAVSQGDTRAALACLDSEAKLLDLYPARKLAVKDEGEDRGPYLHEIVAALMEQKRIEKQRAEAAAKEVQAIQGPAQLPLRDESAGVSPPDTPADSPSTADHSAVEVASVPPGPDAPADGAAPRARRRDPVPDACANFSGNSGT
jgi:hypothetical protein